MIDSGWHPQIFFRLWPRAEIEAAFDQWQREAHGAQLIEAPGAVLFGYFEAVTDVPRAYRSGVSRMDYYTARNLSDLILWMTSDQLRSGLADGQRWFSGLNEVDGQAFSANVYSVTSVLGADPSAELPAFVERFEVPLGQERDFDEWLQRSHAPAIVGQPDVIRVRTFEAVRDGVPIAQYRSPGNRMIRAELAPERLLSTLVSPAMIEALEDSMRWDRNFEYVTRDVFRPLFTYKAGRKESS